MLGNLKNNDTKYKFKYLFNVIIHYIYRQSATMDIILYPMFND